MFEMGAALVNLKYTIQLYLQILKENAEDMAHGHCSGKRKTLNA